MKSLTGILLFTESRGDVRGQLQRGAEPLDPDFYARWLKSKGSVDEAEACIRAHAEWREAFVTRGRIHEVERLVQPVYHDMAMHHIALLAPFTSDCNSASLSHCCFL